MTGSVEISPTFGAQGTASAPPASAFPQYPSSWYLMCESRELRRGPISRILWGRRLVAYRTSEGIATVLDGQCCHLGADLGCGRVRGDRIECPYHHWQFGPDGACQHIPVSSRIPEFARQAVYPAVERGGLLFVFRGREPRFALPFFPNCQPDELVAARAFTTDLDCPWYLIGANAFDLQHFRAAHDRRLAGEPAVDCPAPFARRATALFSVASDSLRDRMTRWFAGDHVELSITDWSGNLMFATATFKRTCSYGLVVTLPLEQCKVRVSVVVFVRRSRRMLARQVFDPLNAWIRRYFIREFLRSDAGLLQGARYNPRTLIDYDRDMVEYFRWLSVVSHGTGFSSDASVVA